MHEPFAQIRSKHTFTTQLSVMAAYLSIDHMNVEIEKNAENKILS